MRTASRGRRVVSVRGRVFGRRTRYLWLAAGVLFLLFAAAFQWRDTLAVRGSDMSRRLIGSHNTVRLEALYFRADDAVTRLRYRLFGGGDGSPVSADARKHDGAGQAGAAPAGPPLVAVAPAAPLPPEPVPVAPVPDAAPAPLPPIYAHSPSTGEGAWQPMTLAGELRAPFTALHPFFTTYVRPDPARPYATVTLVEVAASSVSIDLVAGTSDPGGPLGVSGTGAIPRSVVDGGALLAAFNGGFRYADGHYGMIVDDKTVVPMRDGYATLATYRDGSFRIGIWGRDIVPSWDLVSARQNAIPLVENGAISKEIDAGGTTWGWVWYKSQEFYTARSAVGLTSDGRLVFAEGYPVDARTLAAALADAGAKVAMQMDINRPYTQFSLYETKGGGTHGFDLTNWMGASPEGFFSGRSRDFGYVVIRGG